MRITCANCGLAYDEWRQCCDGRYLVEFTVSGLPVESHPLATQSDNDKAPPPATDVDRVIDQLDKRLVGDTDRGRLRRSLDKADKPLTGRAGADEALGRAIRWAK